MVIFIKIGFIGAGKVGFSFGKYLSENKFKLSGYYSKNNLSSKEASIFTNSKFYLSIKDVVNESDIICVSTPDDEILNIWSELREYNISKRVICHFSGTLSSDVFTHIEQFGAYGYSIHPLFAICDKYNSYKSLKNAFITLEGDSRYINNIKSAFNSLGNDVKIINKKDKTLYHAASVISSNFVLALINISKSYLKTYGFKEEEALKALNPLIINNIKNIMENGIIDSLTGPIERNDVETIIRHYEKLNETDKEIYKLLSKELLNIAKMKNVNKNYKSIEGFLGEGL